MGWQTFQNPGEADDEEAPFCHECSHVFTLGENVKVNLQQGRMLCVPCRDAEQRKAPEDRTYYCAVCQRVSVDALTGFDTCSSCRNRV